MLVLQEFHFHIATTTMRLIFTFIVALPLITGLSYRDKLYDPEHLEKLRQQLQQENRAQLHGSMRQILYSDAGTVDIINPYGQYSHIPCNDTVEGAIVMSLPEKCMNLVCRNNLVIPQYAYGEETCNCCEHNGKMYKEGEEISGVCTKIFCCEGKWQTTGHIDDCCSHCDVYGDPHIKAFDAQDDVNNFYNVHSLCNYSLTQTLEGNHTGSYNPDFGVYAQFFPWLDHWSTNIGMITFTDNPHTVLHIDPYIFGFHVNMNDMNITTYDQPTPLVDPTGNKHPVLVWKQKYIESHDDKLGGSCINVLGSQGLLIHACKAFVRIYAHPSLYEDIGGLCGHFDHYDQNDHMDRGGVYHQLAYAPEAASDTFVNSWTTDRGIHTYCNLKEEYNYCEGEENQITLRDLTNKCTDWVLNTFSLEAESVFLSTNELNNMIQSCILDMCKEGWFDDVISYHYLKMMHDQNSLANMTIGADTVITPLCNSTSQVSTVTETVTTTETKCFPSSYPYINSNSYTTLHTSYTTGTHTRPHTTLPTVYTTNTNTSPFPTNIQIMRKTKLAEIKPTKANNHPSTKI